MKTPTKLELIESQILLKQLLDLQDKLLQNISNRVIAIEKEISIQHKVDAQGEAQPCSADFVMPFGKYRGQTLDQISDNNPGYVVWLADEKVLTIERKFLDAVRMDDMEAESEMHDIINERVHDIY